MDYPPTPPEGGGRLLQGPSFDESQSQAAFQAAVQAWRTADETPVWRPDAAAHAAASVTEGGMQAAASGVAVEALAAVSLIGAEGLMLSFLLEIPLMFLFGQALCCYFILFFLLDLPHMHFYSPLLYSL